MGDPYEVKRTRGSLGDRLASLLRDALDADSISQAELAARMGVSAKHVNHMVNGRSGALGAYDFAAFVLGRRWDLTLEPSEDSGKGQGA